MARKRAGDNSFEPDVNLTSFMDIIFLILAFFVVTFNPPRPERNFDVSLPKPKQDTTKTQSSGELPDEEPEVFQDVTIILGAGPNGTLSSIRLQDRPINGGITFLAQELNRVAGAIRGATNEKLEAANIVASPKLKYRYVIAAIDACYQNQIKKINFAEAPGGGAAATP